MDASAYKRPIDPAWATDYELWTLLEGSCLIGGRCNPVSVEDFYNVVLMHDEKVEKIYRQAKDAIRAGTLDAVPPYDPNQSKPNRFTRVEPEKFISWARLRGYEIPSTLLIAVQTAAEAREQQVLCKQAISSDEAPQGITKQQANTAFGRLVTIDFKNALEECPLWILDARISKGTRGGRHPALWDPVILAVALYEKKRVNKQQLSSAFKTHAFLHAWRDKWVEQAEALV